MSQQNRYTSPLRYPGGKGIIANYIKTVLIENELVGSSYVEVYAGGAGVAWQLLFNNYIDSVYINDISLPLFSFWKSVIEHPEELSKLIVDTPVVMEEWQRQKAILRSPKKHSTLELGFSAFFMNRTNRSGILYHSGVIGGNQQQGIWKIDARYNKADLVQRIQRIAQYANKIKIYNLDAAHFIQDIIPKLPEDTLIYLDPPYFHKGQELYENHYAQADHQDIANLVRGISQPWLVSYDSCPEIDAIYSNYRNIRYDIKYSAQKRYKGSEAIFFSNDLKIPAAKNPVGVKNPPQPVALV